MNRSVFSKDFTIKDILAFTIAIYGIIFPIVILFGIVTIMAGLILFN